MRLKLSFFVKSLILLNFFMLNWLLEPLGFEFMRNALMAGILVGVLCPIVGTYLIVQRMALLGDVMAHSVLPGLAVAFFLAD